ncbi:MAG: hypothetical protein WDZ46_08180 [Solirubrobacterales bacterium]
MSTPPLTVRLRLALSLLGDALRMIGRVPSARERLRMAALTGRSFLRVASRQPGLAGKLIPSPRPRDYELRPEAGIPPLLLRSNDLVCMEVFGGRPYALGGAPAARRRARLRAARGRRLRAASAAARARLGADRVRRPPHHFSPTSRSSSCDGWTIPVGIDQPSRRPSAVTRIT